MSKSFIQIFNETAIDKWDDEVMRNCQGSLSSITYGGLCSKIVDYQNRWQDYGICRGEKIAICAASSIEWASLFMAIQASGYVAVCVPNDLRTSILYIEHSDCSVLYINPDNLHCLDFDGLSSLRYVISIKDGTILWARKYMHRKYKSVKAIDKGTFCTVYRHSSELAIIIYTSGSTANIKGVMLSVGNISSNMQSIANSFPYKSASNYLSVLPFYHIFGLMYDVLMPICYGLHLHILNAPPVPSIIFSAIKKVNPIMFFAVPVVFYKAFEEIFTNIGSGILESIMGIDEKRRRIMSYFGDNCKYLITGGSSVNKEWLDALYDNYDIPFFIGYGMSECAASVCLPNLANYEKYSCGKPIDSVDLKILSTSPFSIPGEIVLRGEVVFMGYYKNKDLTSKVIDKEGWFHTEDMAIISNEGNVFIKGRMGAMYAAASGKNIFLDEIEAYLTKIDGVADAIVSLRGNFLVAYVVRKKDSSKEMVNRTLSRINPKFLGGTCIQEIKWVDSISRTAKGNVKRYLYI